MHTPLHHTTRTTLIRRAAATGDRGAWDELLPLYEPFIGKVLYHLGFRDSDLEDLKQEVYLKLWKGLQSYRIDDPNTHFRSWLSRVIRNAAADFINANRRQSDLRRSSALLNSGDGGHLPEIDEYIETEWRRHIVEIALQRLGDVFTGSAMEVCRLSLLGLSATEVAEQLGLRTNTVYILRHRVKRRLTQEVSSLRDELEGRHE